jgi:hypothetical protein
MGDVPPSLAATGVRRRRCSPISVDAARHGRGAHAVVLARERALPGARLTLARIELARHLRVHARACVTNNQVAHRRVGRAGALGQRVAVSAQEVVGGRVNAGHVVHAPAGPTAAASDDARETRCHHDSSRDKFEDASSQVGPEAGTISLARGRLGRARWSLAADRRGRAARARRAARLARTRRGAARPRTRR